MTSDTDDDCFDAVKKSATRDIVFGGRYRLPDPFPDRDDVGYKRIKSHEGTDKATSWMRATRLGQAIADSYALSLWSQRHVAKGLTLKPNLLNIARDLDPELDRDEFNELCERAKNAASANERAVLGTEIHDATEQHDRGLPVNTSYDRHVEAWQQAIDRMGIEIVDIEEVVCCSNLGVAGRIDRIGRTTRSIRINEAYHIPAGMHLVFDLKTGRDLTLAWHEIAVQLAVYAYADLRYGETDKEGRWYMPRAPMHRHYALVVHIPADDPEQYGLYWLDVRAGWEAAKLAHGVLTWRSRKGLVVPVNMEE